MLRIAVCDDDAAQLERVVDCVKCWPAFDGSVSAFEGGDALLREAVFGDFDIYILDIIMPGRDGIDIGAELRAQGETGEIIYLTSSNEFAADSYEVGAFFYLLKPVDCERLHKVLDAAAEKLRRRRESCILVSTKTGERRILLDELLYVERVGRFLRYYCTDGVVDSQTIRVSFRTAVEELLRDSRFCLGGASYLLNFQHVAGVDGQFVLLDNGSSVALPRASASGFKLAWGKYWLGGH